ncbi:MAG: hypothetical protein KJP17_06925 [Gammaproteobacteria bacterium]|nr:hypothetical protein [Gammaproteobacteria bacterium]
MLTYPVFVTLDQLKVVIQFVSSGIRHNQLFGDFWFQLDDLGNRGGDVLFWNTYNSRPLPDPSSDVDLTRLPGTFLRYVE